MTWVAVAIGGATLVAGVGGSAISASAAKSAAKTQANAANTATELERQQFEQTREDQAPYRAEGTRALREIGRLTYPSAEVFADGSGRPAQFTEQYFHDFAQADFEADPGYQFRLSEGMKALERTAAARGNLMSGRTLKDIGRFSQDTASAEYGNAYNRFQQTRATRFNRLAALAGIGQTATNFTGQAGQSYAANAGELGLQAANARASGYVGSANATSQGLSQLGQIPQQYQTYQALKRIGQQPQSGGVAQPGYYPSGAPGGTGTPQVFTPDMYGQGGAYPGSLTNYPTPYEY
jgi:hypothetical protein